MRCLCRRSDSYSVTKTSGRLARKASNEGPNGTISPSSSANLNNVREGNNARNQNTLIESPSRYEDTSKTLIKEYRQESPPLTQKGSVQESSSKSEAATLRPLVEVTSSKAESHIETVSTQHEAQSAIAQNGIEKFIKVNEEGSSSQLGNQNKENTDFSRTELNGIVAKEATEVIPEPKVNGEAISSQSENHIKENTDSLRTEVNETVAKEAIEVIPKPEVNGEATSSQPGHHIIENTDSSRTELNETIAKEAIEVISEPEVNGEATSLKSDLSRSERIVEVSSSKSQVITEATDSVEVTPSKEETTSSKSQVIKKLEANITSNHDIDNREQTTQINVEANSSKLEAPTDVSSSSSKDASTRTDIIELASSHTNIVNQISHKEERSQSGPHEARVASTGFNEAYAQLTHNTHNVTQVEVTVSKSTSVTPENSLKRKPKAPLPGEAPAQLLSVPSSTPSLSQSSSASSLEISQGRKESVQDDGNHEEVEARRRSGVQVSVPMGVDVSADEELPVFSKSPEDEESIKKAIEKNEFLSKILTGKRLKDIINSMQLRNVPARKTLIKQGEKGSEMFVSKEGRYKIIVKGKAVGEFNDTRVFGELAILYNAKRLATIQAITAGKVWVLDRHVYQKIVISSNLREQDENMSFLQNVQSLNVVNVEVLRQVSNLLKPEFVTSGTVIIRQGDKGDKFYIIRAGTVAISKTGQGVLGTLGKGQCFGEMALQKEDTRQATVTAEAPGVECLTLTRRDFIDHFGDVEIPKIEVRRASIMEEMQSEYQDIKLEDLKIIKTLGVGGFGRVELVQHKKTKNKVFALKYLKKIDIVYQGQQEHVYNEKLIQMNCRSSFIVRLYRTYRDNKYVYFLMESCLGGDLFSLLHKQKLKRFEEKDAKFLSACVIEALEHLHSKEIVYRDLKPENLLIDKNGYLKLTDFGFAKKMPSRGKTFTFAGTPEYVAPEIVLNRGHDRAVDYWAFGAFVFELLTGRTPFRTGDSSHMRTYNKILNGIDNVNFPTYVNARARNLIEKLCRPVPAERLGMQRGGPRDIKGHKWYQGFEWQKFQQGNMPSPFKPKLKDVVDTSNFDLFKPDKDYPPDETSGWDVHF